MVINKPYGVKQIGWSLAVAFLFVASLGLAQEASEPADANQRAVQEALNHVEEIRAQRNHEETAPAQKQEGAQKPTKATLGKSLEWKDTVIDQIQVDKQILPEVFGLLSRKTGVPIVLQQDLTRRVTLYLNNVTFGDLMNIICDLYDLAYVQEGETVKVMSSAAYEEKYQRSFEQAGQTTMVQLDHIDYADILVDLQEIKGPDGEILYDEVSGALILKGDKETISRLKRYIEKVDVLVETEIFPVEQEVQEDLVRKIQDVLTTDVGIISVEKDNKQIIVTDRPETLQEVKRLMDEDRKSVKVAYEVKALQIILYDEHAQGVDWAAIVSDFQRLKCQKCEPAHPDAEERYLSLGTLSKEDFAILQEALDTVGEIKVISEVERVTEKEHVSFDADFQKALYEEGKHLADVEEKQATLQVGVSFLGKNESELALSVDPMVLEGKVKDASAVPQADQSQQVAALKMEDGATLVVGGLITDILVESTRKIPILGDLPFLGFAFRNQGKKLRKSEIVVFISLQTKSE
jgi:hypothetical protein